MTTTAYYRYSKAWTTQLYLHAHMALKAAALANVTPLPSAKSIRYRPEDRLLQFLNAL